VLLSYTVSTLPTPTNTLHFQRLQTIRTSTHLVGTLRTSVIKKAQRYGYIWLTVGLCFILLSLNTIAAISQIKQRFDTQKQDLQTQILNIFKSKDLDKIGNLDAFEKDLLELAKPITSKIGTDFFVRNDIKKIRNVLQTWSEKTAPLTQYKLSKNGLTHEFDPTKYFTNDLEEFFNQLPELQNQTQDLWDSLWIYRSIIWASGGESLKTQLALAEKLIQGIPFFIQSKQQILQALGHFGRQRVLIFNQNVGEARPTGGFSGSYLPIDIIQGKLEIGQSQSIYFNSGQKQNLLVAYPAYWMYGYIYGNENIGLNGSTVNSQFSSCFPDNAKQLFEEFPKSSNGFSTNQIYMISPKFIESILPDNFSTVVEGVGLINKSNFLNEIERKTSLEYASAKNPKEAISPIFSKIIDQLPEIINTQSGKKILFSLVDGMYSRDISMWFADSLLEDHIAFLGLGSDQTCVKKYQNIDILSPVLINMTGDKRGLIAEYTTSMKIQQQFNGKKVTITFSQNLPELKNLQRGFTGEYPMNMFGMQIPSDSFDISIETSDNYTVPFLRKGFKEILDNSIENYTLSEPISHIINSSYNIENGFVYSQIDGSKVVGSYMRDKPVGDTSITFEFTVPRTSGDEIRYFSQVGLGSPSFVIGEGVANPENYSDVELSNSTQLQKGIRLSYR
jgi:hypothetical protein